MKKVTGILTVGLLSTSLLNTFTVAQAATVDKGQVPTVLLKKDLSNKNLLADSEMKPFKTIYNTIAATANNLTSDGYISENTTKIHSNTFAHGIDGSEGYVLCENFKVILDRSAMDNNGFLTIPKGTLKANHTYGLYYRDAGGALTHIARLDFTVKQDRINVQKPQVNPVTNKDKVVTGTAQAGTIVHVTVGDETHAEVVDNNGNFTIHLNQTHPAGTKIEAYAMDDDGNKSDTYTGTVVASPLKTPVVNEVTDKDRMISGTAEPGTTVHITIGGDKYQAVADANGKFSSQLNQRYTANTVIEAYVTDNFGNQSATYSGVVVSAPVTIPTPQVNKVTNKDTKVTGTAQAGTTVHVTVGNETHAEVVDNNGNFTIHLNQTHPVGTKIEAYAMDDDGNKSETYTGTVEQAAEDLKAPIINEVTDHDTVVTGTGEPGAKVTIEVTSYGQTRKFFDYVNAEGEYSINMEQTFPTGTKIVAYQELDGQTSPSTTTTVVEKVHVDVDPVKTDSQYVTGRTLPYSKVTVIVPSQKVRDAQFEGTADSLGNFKVDLQGTKYEAGRQMIVKIVSPDGKTGSKQIEVLPKNPVVDTILAGDTKISGVVDKDATVHIKIGNLPEITTTADYYGKFSQVVDGANLTQNTKVEVWAVSNNIKSEVTTVTVQ